MKPLSILYRVGVRWSGGAFGEAQTDEFHGVSHAASYMSTPTWREPLRVALLVLFLFVFAAWIAYDVTSNQGFAPGIRDSSYVTTDTVSDPRDIDVSPQGGSCFCPCSFQQDPSLAPVATWRLSNTAMKDIVAAAWTCDKRALPGQDTEEYWYLRRYMDAMFLRTLPCPVSPFLLDERAWAAQRYLDAQRASDIELAVLDSELRSRLALGDLSPDNVSAIHSSLVTFARAGVFAVHAYFLGVNGYNAVQMAVLPDSDKARIVNCSVGPAQQKAFSLRETCQPDPYTQEDCKTLFSDRQNPAYEAYKAWCNPSLCSCIKKKQPYQNFIAATAILGGVYSVCSIVMYLLWLGFRLVMDAGDHKASFAQGSNKYTTSSSGDGMINVHEEAKPPNCAVAGPAMIDLDYQGGFRKRQSHQEQSQPGLPSGRVVCSDMEAGNQQGMSYQAQ